MNIYVSRAVVKNISHFVTTLKNIQGVNINVAIRIRDRMCQFIQYQINKEIQGKNATRHKATCWCADGYSPYAWIFDYIVLPVQNIVLIYNMRYDWATKYIKNAKPIREARCLMERMRLYTETDDNIEQQTISELYKPIGSNFEFTDENGIKRTSIMTIRDDSGQMCHIAEDDHCYLLFDDNGKDKPCTHTKWIFPELINALRKLPHP